MVFWDHHPERRLDRVCDRFFFELPGPEDQRGERTASAGRTPTNPDTVSGA